MRDKIQEKLKIVVLMGSPYLYGSEKANIDVFASFKEKYNYVDVLFLTDIYQGDDVMHPYLDAQELTYIPVHYHYRFMKNMTALEWIRKILKVFLGSISLLKVYIRYKPTHIYVSKPEYFLNFLPVLYFSKKPIIYRIGDSPILHNMPQRKLWKFIIKKVSKIICVSKFIEKQVHLSGAETSKTEVIYSRPHENKNRCLSANREINEFFTVLYVGQIGKHKGVDLFVEAAVEICKRYDNIIFNIAGKIDKHDNFSQEQIKIVNKSALGKRIKFLDYVSNVDDLYEKSNLHVCPSVYDEPLANVLIDAKKHAIPSIIFNVGGLPEIIEHKVDGYICNEKNAINIEKAIEYYYINQEKCIEMGEKAFFSLEKLDINRFPERWLNVFTKTI